MTVTMRLVGIHFIWKAQLVKGDFPKRYWRTRGELKLQDGPMWLPDSPPHLCSDGRNFIGQALILTLLSSQLRSSHPQTPQLFLESSGQVISHVYLRMSHLRCFCLLIKGPWDYLCSDGLCMNAALPVQFLFPLGAVVTTQTVVCSRAA